MAKTCKHPSCTYPVFSKGLCMNHWRPLFAKPIAPRTLAQTTNGKPARPFKIAPISKNRQAALKTYRIRRDEHFKKYPVCQFPGCTSTNITLHHARGRTGSFLTNKKYFKSLCHEHHIYVETHPLEAQRLNLSHKRLDK